MKFCELSNSDFEKFGIKMKCEIRFGNRCSELVVIRVARFVILVKGTNEKRKAKLEDKYKPYPQKAGPLK